MIIRGKERKFELNIQAEDEIAQLCPGKDYANIGELMTGGTTNDQQWAVIRVAIAMNRGYEDHRNYEDPEYIQDYLTENDFRFATTQQILDLGQEVIAAMNEGSERTVETKEPAASGKKKATKK